MKKFSQRELLDEGFWSAFKKNPITGIGKGILGAAGATIKGAAKALDYVAPEITQPLHSLERAGRDVGNEIQKGWSRGVGGKEEEAREVLENIGYKYVDGSIKKAGKNFVCSAIEILGYDQNGQEKLGTEHRVLLDKQFNILDVGGKGRRGYMGYAGNNNLKAQIPKRKYTTVKKK